MAKKVALKFGKHSRLNWNKHLNDVREAIKSDDQFHLGIYATTFKNTCKDNESTLLLSKSTA